MRNIRKSGFTMIELLIVIAIMGAVSLVVFQNFLVSEEDAKDAVSEFNKTGVEKVILDYKSIHGVYPCGYHTGLDAAAATASVAGLSDQVALNLASTATSGETISDGSVTRAYTKGNTVATLGANVKPLSAAMQRALREHGIHRFAAGGHTEPGVKGSQAPVDTAGLTAWVLENNLDLYRGGSLNFAGGGTLGTDVVTINGRALSTWNWPGEAVVLVFCTHDINWTAVHGNNPDDTGWGTFIGESKVQMNKPAVDPKAPAESNYPYYIAAFYLSPDQVGSTTGYSCQLLGLLDAELNPIFE